MIYESLRIPRLSFRYNALRMLSPSSRTCRSGIELGLAKKSLGEHSQPGCSFFSVPCGGTNRSKA